tara:strand:- start:429 stop:683 length:255 start_codon:yes stop_codon:yes gene_type:complete
MGTPSIYGSFSFVTELDCDWATMDVRIFYTNHSEGADLDKVEMVGGNLAGLDVSSYFNADYIFDLIRDEIAEADYHWTDHGDVA